MRGADEQSCLVFSEQAKERANECTTDWKESDMVITWKNELITWESEAANECDWFVEQVIEWIIN